jgi:ubiquitin-like domain-containing CTD phosphatase 1
LALTEPETPETRSTAPETMEEDCAESPSGSVPKLSVVIKWSGSEYVFDHNCLEPQLTVFDLKSLIFQRTAVLPARQKLIGLKCKGKPAEDSALLGELGLRPNAKIMMIGTKEADIETINSEDMLAHASSVVNDLDIPEEAEIPIAHREEYWAKIHRRVKEYKVTIFNDPRPGKKLLVLDIDYTLFGSLIRRRSNSFSITLIAILCF